MKVCERHGFVGDQVLTQVLFGEHQPVFSFSFKHTHATHLYSKVSVTQSCTGKVHRQYNAQRQFMCLFRIRHWPCVYLVCFRRNRAARATGSNGHFLIFIISCYLWLTEIVSRLGSVPSCGMPCPSERKTSFLLLRPRRTEQTGTVLLYGLFSWIFIQSATRPAAVIPLWMIVRRWPE